MAELVGEARERILVIFGELFDIELGGLTRAGQPDTNEAWLVVGEHHPALDSGALGFALRSAGTASDAVAVHGDGPSISGAARAALPEAPSAWEPFASAVPREPHRHFRQARLVPARPGRRRAMANWRL